jgi:hypothetical protein
MVRQATAALVVIGLHIAAACAPAAPTPTPTPRPTPTPVWVPATKPEHLAGIWYNAYYAATTGRGVYYRFEPEGTIYWAYTLEDLHGTPDLQARFWFEDGVYYEEGYMCTPVGSYRAYLNIEAGRAVGLRFEEIDDSDRSCYERSREKRVMYVRIE